MPDHTLLAAQRRSLAMMREVWTALGAPEDALDRVSFIGQDSLPSAFPVSDLAAASIGSAALAISDLVSTVGASPAVTVDRRLASLWFGWSLQPDGWQRPPAWDPIAGDYAATDGWIRLHTNAPRHRVAALRVLGCEADRAVVSDAVSAWTVADLEKAVVDQGGCAAAMRDMAAWRTHPQGNAVAEEPLLAFSSGPSSPSDWCPRPDRPLAGIKVLDLTRVLAGPVATRELAGYGAEVLRVDPPDWDEPGVVPEVTAGKRCTRLDLNSPADRRIFEDLLAGADLLVHGYRPGALDDLGYDLAARSRLRPGLIEVAIDAYGWTGPWAGRRGFDSLVQMSTGIAAKGMDWQKAVRPVPLPVQALDLATGYLAAASAVRALAERVRSRAALSVKLSLARTAHFLTSGPTAVSDSEFETVKEADLSDEIERTAWGPARRVKAPSAIDGVRLRWDRGASPLGSAPPQWLP